MGTTVSLSSPEPEDRNVVERAWHILNQKPLRMGSMLRLSRMINDATPNEKLILLNTGVIQRIVEMIDERSHVAGSAASSSSKLSSSGGSPAAKRASGSAHSSQQQGQQLLQTSATGSSNGGQAPQKSPSKAPRNNFVTQITTNSRRKLNSHGLTHRGIGYGFGSTRSHWDIERTIEEQMAREEQMVWLMNSLTAFIFCADPDFRDLDDVQHRVAERDRSHISQEFVAMIDGSSIVPLLEYHLKNESIFDISEHMEFYQALLELASSMCLHSSLTELLIYPHSGQAIGGGRGASSTASKASTTIGERSVCMYLLPRFRDQLLTYLTSPTARMGSPDFRLTDFIQRVQKWCDVASTAGKAMMVHTRRPLSATGNHGSSKSLGTPTKHSDSIDEGGSSDYLTTKITYDGVASTGGGAMSSSSSGLTVSSSNSSSNANELVAACGPLPLATVVAPVASEMISVGSTRDDVGDINSTKQAVDYRNALKSLQINTWKFIGDFGKLVVPFTYRKEAKSLNPFSPSLKERTKRIARELASLHNALPLNWSNSIFIAVDEGRCDIVKVLITGPEETPYQNGCFEFDLFFPSGYPFSPPKVSFLTTGNGEVRFNPNLYQDGKVCLSILNTWEGRPEEKWNPYCSMLQVLVSVQALIFVKEPYFNEPGFERYIGTEKGQHLSNAYNQQLQHATLHYAILEQLKQPPEYFKDVIRRHFWLKKDTIRHQAHQWLKAAQADAAAYAKEKENKKGSGSSSVAAAAAAALDSGLGIVSVRGMERTVELLDQELAQLLE